MFGPFPEHFCATLGTPFLAAGNAIPVWYTRVTFRTDTLPATAHLVSMFKLDHCDLLICPLLQAGAMPLRHTCVPE
jgi:hypothetical protein